jgi:hypothetical protein
MALCLAAVLVPAKAVAQDAVARPAVVSERRSESSLPMPAAKPLKAEPQRRQVAAVALTFTDDHDSVRLPAFATRTTPLPTRFFRVGVEWSF